MRRREVGVLAMELAMVVVGILLALQADGWAEGRRQADQERLHLELLLQDVQEMLSDIGAARDRSQWRLERLTAAISGLQVGDTSKATMEALSDALTSYQVLPPVRVADATYAEMVTSGSLARIDDVNLRRGIAESFSMLGTSGQRLQRITESLPAVDQVVWRRVSYRLLGPDPEDVVSVDFDFETLRRDAEFRNALIEAGDVHADAVGEFDRLLNALEGLASRLAENALD